jgi:hypothetical protein
MLIVVYSECRKKPFMIRVYMLNAIILSVLAPITDILTIVNEYRTATVSVAGGFCNELRQCKWLHLGHAEIRFKLPGFEEKKKKVLLVKSYQFTAIFTKV